MNKNQKNNDILSYFQQNSERNITSKSLMLAMGFKKHDFRFVKRELEHLLRAGKINKVGGQLFRYAESRKRDLVEGIVSRHPRGFGWLTLQEGDKGGLFIPPNEMVKVFSGERVRCNLEESPKGKVAYIREILVPYAGTLCGIIRKGKHQLLLEVEERFYSQPIVLEVSKKSQAGSLKPHDVVEAEITHYPQRGSLPVARFLRKLGKSSEFKTAITRLLIDGDIEERFPEEVIREAKKFGDVPSEEDKQDRLDLSAMALCTIDGADAKDFDDAVFGKLTPKGVEITVAIADVSHYVTLGSKLNERAVQRGTSLYYPGACVPMLPEVLSNGLCSLKPHVPRLCMVATMLVGKRGGITNIQLHEAHMKSHARFTYEEVQAFFDGDQSNTKLNGPLKKSLHALQQASFALSKSKQIRGALAFSSSELTFNLDDKGRPESAQPSSRLFAHKMIEDLMVAANESVAKTFLAKTIPSIYRVHELPDPKNLGEFVLLAKGLLTKAELFKDIDLKNPTAKQLQRLMSAFDNSANKDVLSSLLLRAMKQARYSAENLGHFGLASTAYLHFTSPIRRYPDLIVHRMLRDCILSKKRLTKKAKEELESKMSELAEKSSVNERKAVDVERAITSFFAAYMMKKHVGETDDGVITSVTEFGIFVKLKTHHVDGLIKVADLGSGYLRFDPLKMRLTNPKTNQGFEVGQELKVRIANVDTERNHIDLLLETEPK